jgi:hypothetical protein
MALGKEKRGADRKYPRANTRSRSKAEWKVLRRGVVGGSTDSWETIEEGRRATPLTGRRTQDERNNRVSCDLDVLHRAEDMDIAAWRRVSDSVE